MINKKYYFKLSILEEGKNKSIGDAYTYNTIYLDDIDRRNTDCYRHKNIEHLMEEIEDCIHALVRNTNKS